MDTNLEKLKEILSVFIESTKSQVDLGTSDYLSLFRSSLILLIIETLKSPNDKIIEHLKNNSKVLVDPIVKDSIKPVLAEILEPLIKGISEINESQNAELNKLKEDVAKLTEAFDLIRKHYIK